MDRGRRVLLILYVGVPVIVLIAITVIGALGL